MVQGGGLGACHILRYPLTRLKKFVWQSSRLAPLVVLLTCVILATSLCSHDHLSGPQGITITQRRLRTAQSQNHHGGRLHNKLETGLPLLVRYSHVLGPTVMAAGGWREAALGGDTHGHVTWGTGGSSSSSTSGSWRTLSLLVRCMKDTSGLALRRSSRPAGRRQRP